MIVAPFQQVLEEVVMFLPGRITVHVHKEAVLPKLDTRSQFLDWTKYREKECVGTLINIFLYECGSLHFYNLGAGLFLFTG